MPATPEQLAARLIALDGVVAVVLGGSRARGTAHPDSDVDLGLYYEPATPPSRVALGALAQEIDDRHPSDAVTAFGEWGPWINGGAWLVVGGQRVDWLFRDLARVRRVVADCRTGRPEVAYQLGHPHAYVSATYLGDLDACVPLADPDDVVAQLRRLVRPYPPLLGRALADRFLFEADFSLDNAEKGAARADVVYVAGALYRTVAALTQVLFALNAEYCPIEKGALAAVGALARRPEAFADTATRVLAAPGATPHALRASIDATRALVAAVRTLAG